MVKHWIATRVHQCTRVKETFSLERRDRGLERLGFELGTPLDVATLQRNLPRCQLFVRSATHHSDCLRVDVYHRPVRVRQVVYGLLTVVNTGLIVLSVTLTLFGKRFKTWMPFGEVCWD